MDTTSIDRSKRAALVFIPGISRSWGEGSLRKMADDIGTALNNVQQGAAFTVAPADQLQVPVGSDRRGVRHVTIQRTPRDGGEVNAILDLYELEYVRDLAARQERQPLIWRAVMVAWTLVVGLRQWLGIFTRPGKTRQERAQLLLLLVVLALYAALLGLLFAGIVSLALETIDKFAALQTGGSATPPAGPTPSPSGSPVQSAALAPDWLVAAANSTFGRLAQLGALIAAFIWFLLPPKATIKEFIANTATDYLAAEWYLGESIGASRISGRFVGLVGELVDAGDHGRIDIVGYSLGSIVAINQLFPAGAPISETHALRSVNSLVTIGSPFDLIRLLLPDYFKERHAVPGLPKTWLNVFAPDDILGSNFRNDGEAAQPEPGVIGRMLSSEAPPATTPVPDNVPYLPGGVPGRGRLFGGFRVHGSYWGEGTQIHRAPIPWRH